jgi:hypothetical protein
MKPQDDPKKNPKTLPNDPKAPRPVQQSQIDLERSEGEGMGQGRFQPDAEPTPQADPPNKGKS